MLECVYGGDTGMKKTRTGTDPWAPTSKKSRSFFISEQQDWRVPIYSHFSSLCCYFALLLMVFLNDVIGFCTCFASLSCVFVSDCPLTENNPLGRFYKHSLMCFHAFVSKGTLHAKKLQATDVDLLMWHYLTKLHPSGVMNVLLGHIRLIWTDYWVWPMWSYCWGVFWFTLLLYYLQSAFSISALKGVWGRKNCW